MAIIFSNEVVLSGKCTKLRVSKQYKQVEQSNISQLLVVCNIFLYGTFIFTSDKNKAMQGLSKIKRNNSYNYVKIRKRQVDIYSNLHILTRCFLKSTHRNLKSTLVISRAMFISIENSSCFCVCLFTTRALFHSFCLFSATAFAL